MIHTKESIDIAKQKQADNDRAVNKYLKSLHMEDHEYRHYNNSMGVKVESKEHYKHLLRTGGYVPFDKAQELVADGAKGKKKYEASPEVIEFLREIKSTADSKGNVKLGGRAIAKMREFGVKFGDINPNVAGKMQGGMFSE